MQDKCLGLYYHAPELTFMTVDPEFLKTPEQVKFTWKPPGPNVTSVDYLVKTPTATFTMTRLTPYMYVPPVKIGEELKELPANGHCNAVTYTPSAVSGFVTLVSWDLD
jgi:hypothetical protein